MTFEEAEAQVEIRHFTKQGLKITGVVHVGANDGYEIERYLALGAKKVIAIEPLESAYKILHDRYRGDPHVETLQCALGEREDDLQLNVAGHDGMGSSFLREVNTPYAFIGTQSCPVFRADTLALGREKDCNTLVVDVQGMELQVLRGFGEQLKNFEFLNIECSRVPLYEGEAPAQEVVNFLASQGFVQETPILDHGDVMFRRKQ